VDDAAAAPRAHGGRDGLGHDEGAHEVDAQDLGEVGRADLDEGGAQAHRRRVDQDVHASVVPRRRGRQSFHVRFTGDIPADGGSLAARLEDGVHHIRQRLGPAAEDDHAGALAGEEDGRGAADPGASARDDRDLAVKRCHCRSSYKTSSWDSVSIWAFAPCTRWRRSP